MSAAEWAMPHVDLRAAFEAIFGPTDWDALPSSDAFDASDEQARREDAMWATDAEMDRAAERHVRRNPEFGCLLDAYVAAVLKEAQS